MRKGNLLLCGIVAAAMIVSPCQAVSSNVECRWIPGWYCPSGAESYTDKNSAMAPIWHTDLKGCNFANQWGEILTTDYFDRIGDFSEGMAWVVTNGTVGYIDTMGTLVIRLPENILSCGDFHNGRALIEETDGDKYYIDKTGEIVYHSPENIFLAAEFDEHGIAPAKDLQSGLSREQLATMLYRAVRYIEESTGAAILAEQGSLSGYTDAAQVSPWAQEAITALHAAGILKGTSGTTLSPKDTTTVEQGILLALRAYEMAAGE